MKWNETTPFRLNRIDRFDSFSSAKKKTSEMNQFLFGEFNVMRHAKNGQK